MDMDGRARQFVTRFVANQENHDVLSGCEIMMVRQSRKNVLRRLDAVVALAFSPDGGRLAIATEAGTVNLVDANSWNRRTTIGNDATGIAGLTFSPRGMCFWETVAEKSFAGI